MTWLAVFFNFDADYQIIEEKRGSTFCVT
jgi:hypothetical protein